jgi:deazaflavin-dependent oxidoreductase (nitroreductase family)
MGPYRRLTRRLGHKRWVAAFWRRVGSRIDRLAYRATGGRVSLIGADVLLLTTTGRRTGRARTTPVAFVRDGEALIVSSEDFGQRRPSGWPLNLDAEPRATVQLGRDVIPCQARRLGEEEADRYWERLVEVLPAHATYRGRSGKRHAFALRPADEA